MPTQRTVKDRLTSLNRANPDSSHTTAALAKLMLQGLDGQPMSCTVDRHFRTRVFDFPGVRLKELVPPHTVYDTSSVRADLVGDLKAHFEDSSAHFAISAPPASRDQGDPQETRRPAKRHAPVPRHTGGPES